MVSSLLLVIMLPIPVSVYNPYSHCALPRWPPDERIDLEEAILEDEVSGKAPHFLGEEQPINSSDPLGVKGSLAEPLEPDRAYKLIVESTIAQPEHPVAGLAFKFTTRSF